MNRKNVHKNIAECKKHVSFLSPTDTGWTPPMHQMLRIRWAHKSGPQLLARLQSGCKMSGKIPLW